MQNQIEEANQWLQQRKISTTILENAGIVCTERGITIPVYDTKGIFLYNKYRRHPNSDQGPKYTFDPGSKAALYNAHLIKKFSTIVICEGELDALRLMSEYPDVLGVSSTAGSGTFLKEWEKPLRNKNVAICYDNDKAGWEGMQRVHLITKARMLMLPFTMPEHGDLTDYLNAGGTLIELEKRSTHLDVVDIEEPTKRDNAKMKEMVAKKMLNHILRKERIYKSRFQHRMTFEVIKDYYREIIRQCERITYSIARLDDTEVKKAKAVPMEKLFEGKLERRGRMLVGLCPLHNETTPSFTIYTDTNRWHCYGCNEGYDTIDFIMKLKNVDFKEAITQAIESSYV